MSKQLNVKKVKKSLVNFYAALPGDVIWRLQERGGLIYSRDRGLTWDWRTDAQDRGCWDSGDDLCENSTGGSVIAITWEQEGEGYFPQKNDDEPVGKEIRDEYVESAREFAIDSVDSQIEDAFLKGDE